MCARASPRGETSRKLTHPTGATRGGSRQSCCDAETFALRLVHAYDRLQRRSRPAAAARLRTTIQAYSQRPVSLMMLILSGEHAVPARRRCVPGTGAAAATI